MASTDKLLRIILQLKDEMSAPLERSASGLERMGATATRVGGVLTATLTPAILALGTSAIQAASEWESAFTGVLKTVDGTDEQLAELEAGLRDMATSSNLAALENAHVEIAAIAEAAGQLGVGVDDIEEFTEVVGELSMATNIAGEEGAAMIAQFANVADMPLSDIREFGDVISTLGNNAATTENDILSMGQRLANISQVGFDPDEILAYASALSSMGISAELGGTNFSRGVNEIAVAVAEGGDALRTIANTADMSMEQFRRAFEQDASGAVQSFIEGLSDMPIEQQIAALESLGLSGMEAQRVFMSLAGNTELLTQQLNLAGQAMQGNGALAEEAAKRAETAQGNWNAFMNALMELRIEFGENLLPIFTQIVGAMTGFVSFLSSLPEPVQQAIIVIGMLLAALGPVLMIVGSVTTAIGGMSTAFAGISAFLAGIVPAVMAFGTTLTGLIPILWGIIAPIAPLILALGALALALDFWRRNQTGETWRANGRMLIEILGRLRDRGGNAIQQFARSVQDGTLNAWNSFQDMSANFGRGIVRFVANLVLRIREIAPAMTEIGANIMNGLIEGIQSLAQRFLQMIADMSQSAINAVRNAFGIASPSRVMAGMGANIVEGFNQGIAQAGGLRIPTPSTTSGRVPTVGGSPSFAGAGGGNVNINTVNVPPGTTREQVETVMREIGKASKRRGASSI